MGQATHRGGLRRAARGRRLRPLLALLVLAAVTSRPPVATGPRPRTCYLEYREQWLVFFGPPDLANANRMARTGRVWMAAEGHYRESTRHPRLLRWYVGDERWEWLPEHRLALHWDSAAWPDRAFWLFSPTALQNPPRPRGRQVGTGRIAGRACVIYERTLEDRPADDLATYIVREWWDTALQLPLRRGVARDNWEFASLEVTRFVPDWPIRADFFTDWRLPDDVRVIEAALDLETLAVRLSRPVDLHNVFLNHRGLVPGQLLTMALPVPRRLPEGYAYEGLRPDINLVTRRGPPPSVALPVRLAFVNLDSRDVLWWTLDRAEAPLPRSGTLRKLEWGSARVMRVPGVPSRTRVVSDLGGTRVTVEAAVSEDALVTLIERAALWVRNVNPLLFAGWTRRWRGDAPVTMARASEGPPRIGLTGIATWPLGDALLIRQVIVGGPAARAGVRPWDRVIAIDGVPVAEIAAEVSWDQRWGELARHIRGPEGSTVTFRVLRSGHAKPLELIIRRAVESPGPRF